MPIEVQRRELDAKLVVAAIASVRGYKILVGQDRIVRRLARFLPKGILFDKSIGAKGDAKVYRYHNAGHIVTAMDEEATGFIVTPKLFMHSRMADDTLALTERWFCISETVRNYCVDEYPHHANRFVTTGLARTDTWREPLIALYKREAERLRQQHGGFVLFNSNFGVPNHARGDRFVGRQMKKVESMYDAELAQFARFVSEGRANMEAYRDVIPKILDWLPEHKLIIRPHPAENIDFWKESFKGNDRIVIKSEGVVTPWILASDCMIHHGCTTGIEAEIMGQPHLNYAPVPDIHHDTQMAMDFSQFVNAESELKAALLKIIVDREDRRLHDKPQAKYFASLGGKLASEKIVDEFDKISVPSRPLPRWLSLLRFTPRHLASAFKDLSRRAQAYASQKFHGTSEAELNEKLDTITSALGIDSKITAKQVFKNLYLIEVSV